jgi:oxygen-independent coproporphyrinogen-3 oxidase
MQGLYIHIPFCRKKCFYCDFFSVEHNEYLSSQYIEALTAHCRQYKGEKIDTAYIGGGTPSSLSENMIEKLMNAVNCNFDVKSLCEFTFELNPESVSDGKMQILKAAGVNRLSMGLQSCDDRFLKKIGRIHDFSTFEKAYERARKAGFNNFNIDLIYGLPGQTIKNWASDLRTAVEFDSEHLSLYPLSIEEGSAFFKSGVVIDG